MLVHVPTTARRAAVALELAVFDRKLVVVCDLLTLLDVARGNDDDVLLFHHAFLAVEAGRGARVGNDHAGVGVGLTAVVHKASHAAAPCGVDDVLLVQSTMEAKSKKKKFRTFSERSFFHVKGDPRANECAT